MRAVISVALKRPKATLMVYLCVLVFGIICAANMPRDLLPRISYPRLGVVCTYTGLPAEQVRKTLAVPLEDALSSLDSLRSIRSFSKDDIAVIDLEFHWGSSMETAAVSARQIIDTAYLTLPRQAKKPIVLPGDPVNEPLITVGIFPKNRDLVLAKNLGQDEIKTRLQRVPGVDKVLLFGGREQEICVRGDQERLSARSMSLEDLGQVILNNTRDLPAGILVSDGLEYTVKTKGAVNDFNKLGSLLLTPPGPGKGSVFRLDDVASVSLEQKRQVSFFALNEDQGVGLLIFRQGQANPVRVSSLVKQEVAGIQRDFQGLLEVKVVADSSLASNRATSELTFSAGLGAVLAFGIILVFLKNIKVSLILLISIPISMLTALIFLYLSNSSLNIMSLGGLTLAVGMLVDNSIIVLEHLNQRQANYREVSERVLEVSLSTFGSSLSGIVVFLPLLFLPGIIGALFRDLALGFCFALVGSYFVSVTFVPVLFLFFANNQPLKPKKVAGNKAARLWANVQRGSLNRPKPAALAGLLVFIFGLLPVFFINREYFPLVNTFEIKVNLTFPPGTTLESIGWKSKLISRRIRQFDFIDSTLIIAGNRGSVYNYIGAVNSSKESSEVRCFTTPGSIISPAELALIRSSLDVPGLAGSTAEIPDTLLYRVLGLARGTRLIRVTADNPDRLNSKLKQISSLLSEKEIFPVDTAQDRVNIVISPNRPALANFGLNLSDLGKQSLPAFYGSKAGTFELAGREIDIRVTLAKNQQDIKDLLIRAKDSSNSAIRLKEVAEVAGENSPSLFYREGRKDTRLMRFSEQIFEQNLSVFNTLTQTVPGVDSSYAGKIAEHLPQILVIFVLAVVLLYLSLGILFESFTIPVLLMASIPPCFMGIALSLWAFGLSLNINSGMGLLVLFGNSVNSMILLYDCCNKSIVWGQSVKTAVYSGILSRTRPILITTLTTVFALIPVAWDPLRTSGQSSLAAALLGGAITTTLSTFFIQPHLFIAYFKLREKRKL